MSNPQMSAALFDRAMERLFARFAAMYGDAAMKRMWGQQSPEAVKAIWADSLARFDVQAIMAGLRNLEDAGNTFPPTLPEFIAACRRKPETVPAEHRPYLPPPEPSAAERAAGKALADRIARQIAARPAGRDPAEWAYRVIKRYEGGDRGVAHASYKQAQDALRELGRAA
jgi:hypothetical protein